MKLTQEDIKLATHYAWQLVGIPYKLGGNVPQDGGMDCSAFCLELLRVLKLWDTSDATAQMIFNALYSKAKKLHSGKLDCSKAAIQEGDFLFFGNDINSITHIAYGITPAYMLEAGGNDKTGMIRLRSVSWRKDLVGIARFV